MHVSYDRESDAAYLRIVEERPDGEAVRQVPVTVDGSVAEFVFDFDRLGRLLGIEVLGASTGLRPETLALAK